MNFQYLNYYEKMVKTNPDFIKICIFIQDEIHKQQIEIDKNYKNNCIIIFGSVCYFTLINVISFKYDVLFPFLLLVFLIFPILKYESNSSRSKLMDLLNKFHYKMDYPKYLQTLKEYQDIIIYKNEYYYLNE